MYNFRVHLAIYPWLTRVLCSWTCAPICEPVLFVSAVHMNRVHSERRRGMGHYRVGPARGGGTPLLVHVTWSCLALDAKASVRTHLPTTRSTERGREKSEREREKGRRRKQDRGREQRWGHGEQRAARRRHRRGKAQPHRWRSWAAGIDGDRLLARWWRDAKQRAEGKAERERREGLAQRCGTAALGVVEQGGEEEAEGRGGVEGQQRHCRS